MEPREKIAWALSQMEETTDFSTIAELKAAMNSVYGEDKNQIVKPTMEKIIEYWESLGTLDTYLSDLSKAKDKQIISILGNFPHVFYYQAIIYFPEITITNGLKSHKIKDIYVNFSIRPDGTIVPIIRGMRTTVTEAEYLSLYLHSHLRRLDPTNIKFNPFCTGAGEINQILLLLNVKYKAANFMMFMMHIRNYLEWESKEGSPYIYMDSITKGGTSLLSGNLADWVVEKAADHLIKLMGTKLRTDEIMSMFTFTVSEGGIVAKNSLKIEKWMALQIEDWNLRDMIGHGYEVGHFLTTRDVNGVYHSIHNSSTVRVKPYDGVILNFKGREIKFQITDKSEAKKDETYANPKITKEVCKKLSRLFTKTAISTPGIKSGNSITYNNRTPEPDNLPVFEDMDRGVVGDALL